MSDTVALVVKGLRRWRASKGGERECRRACPGVVVYGRTNTCQPSHMPHLRDAEVAQAGAATCVQQDIPGLQIAMDHVERVEVDLHISPCVW